MPAVVTVYNGGVAEREKSERKTVRGRDAVCEVDELVPVTVKSKGLEVVAERPLTVTVLDWPISMDEGLNEQVALEQDKLMLSEKVLGPVA